MDKTTDKKKLTLFLAAAGLIAVIIALGFFAKKDDQSSSAVVNQAGKVGEKVTNQLLVQIERAKGNPNDMSGRYERGDIVLIAPAKKEWSEAEKRGFLILKMNLTSAQADLLTKPLIEEIQAAKNGSPEDRQKTLKRRRFAVDMARIGITDEDEKGRLAEDRVFGAEIIIEKN